MVLCRGFMKRGYQPRLGAHLETGLGVERAHQPMQGVKSQLDIEAPLLLRRYVCDAPVFSLGGREGAGTKSGVSLGRSVGGRRVAKRF